MNSRELVLIISNINNFQGCLQASLVFRKLHFFPRKAQEWVRLQSSHIIWKYNLTITPPKLTLLNPPFYILAFHLSDKTTLSHKTLGGLILLNTAWHFMRGIEVPHRWVIAKHIIEKKEYHDASFHFQVWYCSCRRDQNKSFNILIRKFKLYRFG